jgi:hypothetical protein
MPNPYLHWDVAENHNLHVTASNGPLIVDENRNKSLLAQLVAIQSQEVLATDATVGYFQQFEVVDDAQPNTGIKISQYQYMPVGLNYSIANPADSEPQMHDYSNPFGSLGLSIPYGLIGYRASLRGWVATAAESNLQCNVIVKWEDGKGTRLSGSARGGYTGHGLVAYNMKADDADYVFMSAHGKRPTTDTDWANSAMMASPAGVVSLGTPIVNNNVSGDKIRIVSSGGEPLWDIKIDQDLNDTDTWTNLFNTSQDLTSELITAEKNYLALTAELFAGSALIRDWAEPPLTAETFFNYIEVSQFEPWVIDKSSWGLEDWDNYMSWLTGSTTSYSLERRMPQKDLRHIPLGEEGSPTTLRKSDSDLGICLEFNDKTYLIAQPAWDIPSTAIPSNLVNIAVCDDSSYGADAPMTAVGKFKLQNMVNWTDEVDILGAGDWHASVPSSANGMGIFWRQTGGSGEGELVARAWHSISSSWKEAITPFNAEDHNDKAIELAMIWTGARGSDADKSDNTLSLAINSTTKASVDFGEGLALIGTEFFTIGSKRSFSLTQTGYSFQGLFREAVVFADALSDESLLSAFNNTTTEFINPSFELPDESRRPGEALSWIWESLQQAGGWADFNEYDQRLRQWATATENFGAGFFYSHEWRYTDEAERLSATGFIAGDVNKSAYQVSNDTMWKLINNSPATWVQVEISSNEAWIDNLSDVETNATLFNEGVGVFETIQELFAIWKWGAIQGTPWLDSYTFTSPATDNPPIGWSGYAFDIDSDFPLTLEQFNESWGSDPFTTNFGWNAVPAQNGKFHSNAIEFPVTILPNKNQLLVKYTEASEVDRFKILTMTPGEYASATELATMVDTQWQSEIPSGNNIEVVPWIKENESGISFQWDGTSTTLRGVGLGTVERTKNNDVRETIGLTSLSASTVPSDVKFPAEFYADDLPSGIIITDTFLIDSWSQYIFLSTSDPNIASDFAKDYTLYAATFDSTTILELLTLVGWFGPGAEWKEYFDVVDLTSALFDAPVNNTMEKFLDTEWPEEPFPE